MHSEKDDVAVCVQHKTGPGVNQSPGRLTSPPPIASEGMAEATTQQADEAAGDESRARLVLTVSAGDGVCLLRDGQVDVQLAADGTAVAGAPDGSAAAVCTASAALQLHSLPSGACVAQASLPAKASSVECTAKHAVCFVPPGTDRQGSVYVFSTANGSALHVVGTISARKAMNPMIQFVGHDEALAARHENDELCVYSAGAVGEKSKACRLLANSAAAASVAPDGQHAAVFIPERKSTPAGTKVHALPTAGAGKTDMHPLALRTFYRAKSASLLWSPTSNACIVWAASDVDATNKSYYGESGLHIVRPDGHEQRVELDKEGPVHDVSWSPNGDRFITVQGFLPSPSVCVHDAHGNKKQKVFDGSYNGAQWNRFGTLAVLYGFGNLPGDITFLDKKPDGKLKTFASTRMRSHTQLEWLADGRHVVVSALTPRIREGNGTAVLKYSGEHVADKRYSELTGVSVVGLSKEAAAQFNRPPSPSAKQNRTKCPQASAEANTYRPKHLQHVQPLPTQKADPSTGNGTTYKPPNKRDNAPVGPPGSEGMDIGGNKKSENAKKRERRRKKKSGAAEGNGQESLQ